MPVRPFLRDEVWMFPPTLGELVPQNHPARFVAAFVDAIDRATWATLGISLTGEWYGAAAYHPRALLAIWLYGFMTGVRSARKLEAACYDQIPYIWLSGRQFPDHNTLWRFYRDHRKQMRKLLKRTVRTAVKLGLLDLAVQAVDGSKIGANAARDRTLDNKGLAKLLERTDEAIRELEAQNGKPSEIAAPRLPESLAETQALIQKVRVALEGVENEDERELECEATESNVGETVLPQPPKIPAESDEQTCATFESLATAERSEQGQELMEKNGEEALSSQLRGDSAQAETGQDLGAVNGAHAGEDSEQGSEVTDRDAGEAMSAPMSENHALEDHSPSVEGSPSGGREQCREVASRESASSPRSTDKLVKARALREQASAALDAIRAGKSPARVNLTDADVGLVQGRQGPIVGYNAQAAVVPLNANVAGPTGRMITASDVTERADDHDQPVSMLKQAEDTVGQKAAVNLFDGGYHSGANLEACAKAGYNVLMAEAQSRALKNPYHKDRFVYDPVTDTYKCPEGHTLSFRGTKEVENGAKERTYGLTGTVCLSCPAYGKCTKDRKGRRIGIGPHEETLRTHRNLMATEEARATYSQRKELPEPVFGTMKEEQGARRFLLRGLENVRSEWSLLSTAFNLRTLSRVWQQRPCKERETFCTGVTG